MSDVKVVRGLDELAVVLRSLAPKIAKKYLRKAVVAGAREIRDEARRRVPVDTGRLRNAIIVKFIPEESNDQVATYYVLAKSGRKYQQVKRTRKGKSVVVNEDAFYWRFVEFGTAKMSARPFMRPAFQTKREKALSQITDKLREGLQAAINESNVYKASR